MKSAKTLVKLMLVALGICSCRENSNSSHFSDASAGMTLSVDEVMAQVNKSAQDPVKSQVELDRLSRTGTGDYFHQMLANTSDEPFTLGHRRFVNVRRTLAQHRDFYNELAANYPRLGDLWEKAGVEGKAKILSRSEVLAGIDYAWANLNAMQGMSLDEAPTGPAEQAAICFGGSEKEKYNRAACVGFGRELDQGTPPSSMGKYVYLSGVCYRNDYDRQVSTCRQLNNILGTSTLPVRGNNSTSPAPAPVPVPVPVPAPPG